MNKLFYCIVVIAALTGCKSAQRDDYVTATSLNKNQVMLASDIRFSMGLESKIDLRGEYESDRSLSDPSVLYSADAGAAGLLVQILAHSAINSSRQESKLAEQQQLANVKISPLLQQIETLTFSNLITQRNDFITEDGSNLVKIKPLFFAAPQMNKLSLKLIAWIDNPNASKSKKQKLDYQNLFEVHSRLFEPEEIVQLTSDQEYLLEQMRELLNTALSNVKKDLSGQFDGQFTQKTIHVVEGERKSFVRAYVVEQSCKDVILKNLRKWVIQYPVASTQEKHQECEVLN